MKRNKLLQSRIGKTVSTYFIVFVLTLLGYSMFYNRAFSGYEPRGAHIWLSGSTVKFVNNWLQENPLKLRFLMLEYPASVEFNDMYERSPYISYPPGTILPPYLLAKILGKNEIQIGFIKRFLQIKYLLDTLLVTLIFFSLLSHTLKVQRKKFALLSSVVMGLCWMNFPIISYYMRNVYFSDQCIITVVLLFVWLEIYDDYFSKSKPAVKSVYCVFKFIISLYGVLTDYYFLFVLLVAALIKIISAFCNRKNKTSLLSVLLSSLVYVLPVICGIGLFIIQITAVPDFERIIVNKMLVRMANKGIGRTDFVGIPIIGVVRNFVGNYWFPSVLVVCAWITGTVFLFVKKQYRTEFAVKNMGFIKIMLLVFVPPVLQVLVLQQHSAVHEFSMLKFGLPVILAVFACLYYLFEIYGIITANLLVSMENGNRTAIIKLPAFYLALSLCTSLFVVIINISQQNRGYFSGRIGSLESYEKEHLIKEHYNYDDVYFSFTEAIVANPPNNLAISNKLVYKIDNAADIRAKFPALNKNARILLLVNKNNTDKDAQEKECGIIGNKSPVFESENYAVYTVD
jgi:hypothetical protein